MHVQGAWPHVEKVHAKLVELEKWETNFTMGQTGQRGDLFLSNGVEIIKLYNINLMPENAIDIVGDLAALGKFGIDEATSNGMISTVRDEVAQQFCRE